MTTPLVVLMVEDSERDADLLLRALRQGGFAVTYVRVETADAMRAALARQAWDIVLSDYDLPSFGAHAAHAVMREAGFDLPFIIVSGTVDEATAVDAMRAGAHDFFVKGRLGPRLIAAIERELREAAIRTERKAMQQQLLISDRMVSMGTLAAGVAHEINNPLAAVLANLDLAADELATLVASRDLGDALGEIGEELADARTAARRIRDIVRDLKIFSRADDDRKDVVAIRPILESTLRMAWNEIRHRARLVKTYGDTPDVVASDSRLGQVFLNLIVNAAQAIPVGDAARNEIRITTRTDAAGNAVIEIADTGSGMTPEVQARLFTPFFTTKPVGIGTGLGLSICRGIVTSLGGTIEVTSTVGEGSCFRVVLVPASGEAQPHEPSPAEGDRATVRRGRILCVDDEPMIGKAVQRTLEPAHEVVVVTGADEALRRIRAGERFDVILCDVMMPQMTGIELHAELRAIAADQAARMIFLTGGAFTAPARAFLDQTKNLRVEKPFEPSALRTLVEDRLR